MGEKKGKGYLLASLLGSRYPFCSCSTIPMLRGLLSAKAGLVRHSLFLFVSPLLNPIIVGLVVGYLWLESNFVVRDHRCRCLSPCQYRIGFTRFERHIVAHKTQHQVVAPRNAMISKLR